jgi:hypothetical protein
MGWLAIVPAATLAVSLAGCGGGPGMAAQVESWRNGPGGLAAQAVRDDLDMMVSDVNNGDVKGVKLDGTNLMVDAAKASKLPPPAGQGKFAAGMSHFMVAGSLVSAGLYDAAVQDMDAGGALVRQAASEMDAAK